MIKVVKIGGGIIDDAEQLSAVLDSIAASSQPVVLVHGGGRLATDLAKELGVEQRMEKGRRITDLATLRIVTMTYAGWINKSIVAALQGRGRSAIGMTGADLDLIRSTVRSKDPVDFGYVGDPAVVNIHAIRSIMTHGAVLVVAPITHDGKGTLLNTNADTIAAEIAAALAPDVELTFAFDLSGVMQDINDPASVIANISREGADGMLARGEITEGMLPKLENAFRAIERGVKKVRIARYDAIDTEDGTWIS